uniref:Protein phosphatase 1 regulatory subunit 1B n=1 Tax=Monopterus albus TaxID=43700 RepID=A0A3Q3RDM4_MONAL|nr:protein phosphatase 1 regulatory subunit 1B-like [Monopterus albus]
MDPLLPTKTEVMERETDQNSRRKIQFSVPSSVPTQLDPQQVDMIRRRRPTPATLFRLTDPPSPEEDSGLHQWVLGENGALKAKLVHVSTYQPPSLKDVQTMAQAQLSSIGRSCVDSRSSGEEEEEGEKRSQQTDPATDIREENKSYRDPCGLWSSLTISPDQSHHYGDEREAQERQEGKGE